MNVWVAILGVVVLFVGWVAVQSLVRRHNPDFRDGEDVLACGMCSADGSCHCGLRSSVSRDSKTRIDLP